MYYVYTCIYIHTDDYIVDYLTYVIYIHTICIHTHTYTHFFYKDLKSVICIHIHNVSTCIYIHTDDYVDDSLTYVIYIHMYNVYTCIYIHTNMSKFFKKDVNYAIFLVQHLVIGSNRVFKVLGFGINQPKPYPSKQ
jgi:hypothetical protein